MRAFRGAMTIMLAFALASCGGGGGDKATAPNNTGGTGGTGGGGGGGSTTSSISVKDNFFDPSATTVPTGTTVTWTWTTGTLHNVTFDNAQLSGSGNKDAGNFTKTFPNTGAFTYHCSIHPGMEGTITVH